MDKYTYYDRKVIDSVSVGEQKCLDSTYLENMRQHPIGAVLLDAYDLALKKNADYATPDNVFANFEQATDLGVLNSRGVAVRLSDKWIRFCKGVRTDWNMAVGQELAKDTCLDIINYSAIYYCILMSEKKPE